MSPSSAMAGRVAPPVVILGGVFPGREWGWRAGGSTAGGARRTPAPGAGAAPGPAGCAGLARARAGTLCRPGVPARIRRRAPRRGRGACLCAARCAAPHRGQVRRAGASPGARRPVSRRIRGAGGQVMGADVRLCAARCPRLHLALPCRAGAGPGACRSVGRRASGDRWVRGRGFGFPPLPRSPGLGPLGVQAPPPAAPVNSPAADAGPGAPGPVPPLRWYPARSGPKRRGGDGHRSGRRNRGYARRHAAPTPFRRIAGRTRHTGSR